MGKKGKVKRGKGGKIKDAKGKAKEAAAEGKAEAASEAAVDNEFTRGITTTFTVPKSQRLENVRDVNVQTLSLAFHGNQMLNDTQLSLNYGQRYGLVGQNGCGKSCLLNALGYNVITIPDYIDLFHLDREIDASDMTALEAVLEVDEAKKKLEAEEDELTNQMADSQDGDDEELQMLLARLTDVQERLDVLGADTAEARAASILAGLQFSPAMQVSGDVY